MLKLIEKGKITILHSKNVLNWTFYSRLFLPGLFKHSIFKDFSRKHFIFKDFLLLHQIKAKQFYTLNFVSINKANLPWLEFLGWSFFFKKNFSKKKSIEPSECQTVWLQIRPDILLGPIRLLHSIVPSECQTVWIQIRPDILLGPIRILLSIVPSECQTVWIQIRPDILSGLIWVKTVCKGYQQTTKDVSHWWVKMKSC